MHIPGTFQDDSSDPIVIVAGIRTPMARSFGPMANLCADELGRLVVDGVLKQTGVRADQVDEVVFGNVASPADASNVARVIVLRAGIPHDRIAHTVNRNCASGMEAVTTAWQILRDGRAKVVVAGGTESMSNAPLLWSRSAQQWFLELSRTKSLVQRLTQFTKFRPRFLKPIPALQVGLTDPTCGLNMGQTAENLAREFGITREEQDRFALASHQKALAAWERCDLKGEVLPLTAEHTQAGPLDKDNGPRAGQTIEALARLKPIFESHGGTVTVGNSCPITDGAAALLLMPASHAKSLGLEPLGILRAYSIAGCDQRRMGLGPVFAIHKLLAATGGGLGDFDLVEINESFAAQVLACEKALASDDFCRRELGRDRAIGQLDESRLNVNGGAIALGHPVGMSGARLILTLLRALRKRGGHHGLATLCVGGGQGQAVWVDAV
jgi:acetyl-CoA C-acetyltransferase/acetyl-CoA acyltransferase